MAEEQPIGDRHISIQRDAIASTLISGDENKVFIYNYHLEQKTSLDVKPVPQSFGSNPYRGLASFQSEDADLYFGREVQVDRLWNRLRDLSRYNRDETLTTRLLPILGPSGSGKSSLVRAGLIPELARRPLPALHQPRIVVMTPSSTPLEALAVVLARISENNPTPVKKTREFLEELRLKNSVGKYDGLRRIVNTFPRIEVSPLIVLIDQFEEAYSLCKDATERQVLIENLLESATTPEARVVVVITLRSDFLGETQKHPQLNQIIGSDNNIIVPAMTTEELRQAIAEPAKYAGHPLDGATVDLLIEQTKGREGALPLLQFALTRIWEGMVNGSSPNAALKSIGGVGGALAGEAQRIYDNLQPQEKEIARRIFIGLVEVGEGTGDTRRRVQLDLLRAQGDDETDFKKVLNSFSDPGVRLITLASDTGAKETAEVTHEALFEHWQQLASWIDDRRGELPFQRRLEKAATHWIQSGRHDGNLWRAPDLNLAQSYYSRHSHEISPQQNYFFLSSIKAQRKAEQRIKRNRYAFITLSLLLTAISVFAQQQLAERQFQAQFSSVLLGGSTEPEIFSVLPRSLQVAEQQTNDNKFNEAIGTYKAVLRAVQNFGQVMPEKIAKIEGVRNKAEEELAKLFEEKYINEDLVQMLEKGQFGKSDESVNDVTQFEEQYTEGALKITYAILMRKPGLELDENNNGRLDIDEIIYLPCNTLQRIEDLWRQATNYRCGFYGESIDFEKRCQELSGKTLSFQIFHADFDSVPAIEERLQVCQITENSNNESN